MKLQSLMGRINLRLSSRRQLHSPAPHRCQASSAPHRCQSSPAPHRCQASPAEALLRLFCVNLEQPGIEQRCSIGHLSVSVGRRPSAASLPRCLCTNHRSLSGPYISTHTCLCVTCYKAGKEQTSKNQQNVSVPINC